MYCKPLLLFLSACLMLGCDAQALQPSEGSTSKGTPHRVYQVKQPVFDLCFLGPDSTLVTLERADPQVTKGFYEIRLYKKNVLLDSRNTGLAVNAISCVDEGSAVVASLWQDAGTYTVRVGNGRVMGTDTTYLNPDNPIMDGEINYAWRSWSGNEVEIKSRGLSDTTGVYMKRHGLRHRARVTGSMMWHSKDQLVTFSFRDKLLRVYSLQKDKTRSVKSVVHLTAAQTDNTGRFVFAENSFENRDFYLYDMEKGTTQPVPQLNYGWWGALYSCGDTVVLLGGKGLDDDYAVIVRDGKVQTVPTNLAAAFDDSQYLYRTYRVKDGYELHVTPRDACVVGVP